MKPNKTKHIVSGLSGSVRLIVRAKSYRVQVKGLSKSIPGRSWSRINGSEWYDVQKILRGKASEEVTYNAAMSAFRRREVEVRMLKTALIMYGAHLTIEAEVNKWLTYWSRAITWPSFVRIGLANMKVSWDKAYTEAITNSSVEMGRATEEAYTTQKTRGKHVINSEASKASGTA